MRMKMSRLENKYLRNIILTKDDEGGNEVSWSTAIPITCEIWGNESLMERSVSGQSLLGDYHAKIRGEYSIEQEGNHQKYVFNGFSIRETDGLCIYVGSTDEPDFIVKGITPYKPLLLTLARAR